MIPLPQSTSVLHTVFQLVVSDVHIGSDQHLYMLQMSLKRHQTSLKRKQRYHRFELNTALYLHGEEKHDDKLRSLPP